MREKDKNKVVSILNKADKKSGPFNHSVKFFYVDNKENQSGTIGTYGFIKNPPSFIGGVVENTAKGMIDFGYLFEEIILKLTEENLGTCWLGGTFTRSDFDIEHKSEEIIACVSPVGYEASSMSLREKVIRKVSNANNRKPFDALFFVGEKQKPVPKTHIYRKYLKAIQLAPSASNKQPWRVIIEDSVFHFYLKRTKGYGSSVNMDIQAIDMGIAINHLIFTLKEDEITYQFSEKIPYSFDGAEYILSVSVDGD